MPGTMITQDILKRFLDYDPNSGIFIWKVSKQGPARKGGRAGTMTPMGYIGITINRKRYMAHRLAWLYVEGYIPEAGVGLDHINRKKDDNRFKNLRMVSQQCNLRNASISNNNTSGIKGVSWSKEREKWEAYITISRKRKPLGRHDNLIDAAKARWEAEKKYNYIECNTDSTAYNFLFKKQR